MTKHDRLFKVLLRNFFTEFLQLFLPEVAATIVPGTLEFVNKEFINDPINGKQYYVDILVKVVYRSPEQDGKEIETNFLIHVEDQNQAEADFNKRMFDYFAVIYVEYKLPIYPVALFTYDQPYRPEPDTYTMHVIDRDVNTFNFATIQLNRLDWRNFIKSDNPVAAALMEKMRIAPKDRVRVKLECMRMLSTSRINPAKERLIWNFVQTYLKLNEEDEKVYNENATLLQEGELVLIDDEPLELEPGPTEQIMARWERKGVRNTTLRQLTRRFGVLPEVTEARIHDLPIEQLEALTEALLDFATINDLDQWLQNANQ